MTMSPYSAVGNYRKLRSAAAALLAFSMIAVAMALVLPSAVSAQVAVSGEQDEPGVNLYTAGSSGTDGDPLSCDGAPGAEPTNVIVQTAVDAGVLEFIGDVDEEVVEFTVGQPGENFAVVDGAVVDDADTTEPEVWVGLTAIDDFGTVANGGDDDANFDGGTGGSVSLTLTGQAIIPDGVLATGQLNSDPNDPVGNLDGNEIFIFEDAEFSGYTVTLIGLSASYTISVDDYQVVRDTQDGAVDSMMAIDLDTLIANGSFPDFLVQQIIITDDGVSQGGVSLCPGIASGFDTALELDAVATRGDTLPSLSIEKSTNGEDADDAPGPAVLVGDAITWTYVVTNTGSLPLIDLAVTDNQIDASRIDCGDGTNVFAGPLLANDTFECTATGTAVEGQYENIGTVRGVPLNSIGQPIPGANIEAIDPSHYIAAPRPLATLGDRVWEDLNENGLQDDGEPGIAGITVNLLDEAGAQIDSTVTGDDGSYLFTDLPPNASYSVVFVADGRTFTAQDAGDDAADSDADPATGQTIPVLLGDGESNLTIDAGILPIPASLGDRVWEDLNENGLQDDGEPGIAGVTVNLLDANGTVLDTIITGDDGAYLFTDLNPSVDYQIEFVPPADRTFTTPDAGDDALDSDADPATGLTPVIDLAPGEANVTIDAGITPQLASLGDFVWDDVNGDGQQEGEPGTPDVVVNLLDINGQLLESTVTGADGSYLFTDLPPNTSYIVEFIAPAGRNFTIQDFGADVSDSDVDPATGRTAPVLLGPAENNLTIDAGILLARAAIGDLVFEDSNNDGLQGAGESGIAGVTVNLLNADGSILDTMMTDADGLYLFDDLDPSIDYQIEFVLPAGAVFSPQDAGDDALDSDADPVTGRTAVIDIAPGETNLTLDAGIVPLGAIGDRVWLDLDGDGEQDPDEPGIPGVTVELRDPAGNVIDSVVTGPDGEYIFTDLPPADYVVVVVPPADREPTFDLDGGLDNQSEESLDAGEENLDHDFGFIPPGIVSVEKSTNGLDSDVAPGGRIAVGDPVTWTYVVSNDGLVDLFNVTVTDSVIAASEIDCGDGTNVIPTIPAGGAPVTCTAQGIAIAGPYQNTATVTGDDPRGTPIDPATDPSNYFGGDPGLSIQKSTNGVDADAEPGPSIPLGDTVTWTYTVLNEGNEDLTEVTVTDSVIDASAIDCGDGTNVIGLLAAGAPAVVCTAVGVATLGQYENVGTVSGLDPDGNPVGSVDPSHYFGEANPSVSIAKSTNGEDADVAPGPSIDAGDTVTWTYTVVNDGDVDLADVTVTDSIVPASAITCEGSAGNVIALLTVGQTVICTATGDAVLGQYENLGSVTGTPVGPDGEPLVDPDGNPLPPAESTDPSNYFGDPTVSLRVEKATNGQDADVAPGPAISVGGTVVWTYEVFNDSNVSVGNIALGDDIEGAIDCPTDILAPGASMICTREGVAGLGAYENLATVTGDPVNDDGTPLLDSSGNPVPGVEATDPSNYQGVAAAIGDRVWKDLNADGVQDADEDPINGVEVVLTLVDGSPAVFADGTAVPSQVTAGDGNYLFTDLPSGSYIVTVTPPAGLTQTYDLDGTDSANTSREELAQEEANLDHDFGYIPPGLLDVDKVTNGSDGLTIRVGSPITWTYTVNNVGEVVVTDVTVTDNLLDDSAIDCGDGTNVIASMAAGATVVCTATGVATEGPYENTATVTGTDPTGDPTDPVEDPSDYTGSPIPLGNIGDFVWDDLNGDGVQDEGEPGIPGVTVTITLPDGSTDTTETDEDGLYLFPGLPAGEYTITVSPPADRTQTYDIDGALDDTSTVELVEDADENIADRLDQDFGYIPPASFGVDKVTGTPGVTGGDGQTFVAGEAIVWTYTVTNTGRVTVTNIVVSDNMLDDSAISCEGSGDNTVATLAAGDTVVCTADGIAEVGLYENTATVTGDDPLGEPLDAQDPSDYEGIEVLPALVIGDYVWIDANENGVQDANEAPVANADINLWTWNSTTNAPEELKETKTTDADGKYNFTIDFDTDYVLQITLPSGARLTQLDAGNDDAVDSDFDPSTGITAPIRFDTPNADGNPAPEPVENLTFDAGLVPLEPGVSIEKTTNGTDADTGNGPDLVTGDAVMWVYTVTNTGGTILDDVTVTDDLVADSAITCAGSSNNVVQRLMPGESATCSAQGTAIDGQYNNVGSATGTPVDDAGVPLVGPDGNPLANPVADDPSAYVGTPAPTPTPTSTPIPTPTMVPPTPTPVVIVVVATPTPTPKKKVPLAHTGAETGALSLFAAGLLAAGGVTLLASRRRREFEEAAQ